ncbi:hypothetical protein PLESTM_001464000 [Pleodorina starrii]|nr:hypothetical protein PLESTM_001464000 [Pleodorina starrii]
MNIFDHVIGDVPNRLRPTSAPLTGIEVRHGLEAESRQPGNELKFEADNQSRGNFVFFPGGDGEARLPAIDGAAMDLALLPLTDAILLDNFSDDAAEGRPLQAGPGSSDSSSGGGFQSAAPSVEAGPAPEGNGPPERPLGRRVSSSGAQHAPPANPEKICDLVLDMDAAAAAVSAALIGIHTGLPPQRRAGGPCDAAATAAAGMLGARIGGAVPPPPPPPRRSSSQHAHSIAAAGGDGGGGAFFPYPLLHYHQSPPPPPPPPPPPRQYLRALSQPAMPHPLHPPALPTAATATAAAAASADMSGRCTRAAVGGIGNLTAPPVARLSAMVPPGRASAAAAGGGCGGGLYEPPESYTSCPLELPRWRVSISGPTVDLAEDGRAGAGRQGGAGGPPQRRPAGRWHASSSGLPSDMPSYSYGGYPPYAYPSTTLPPYMSDQHVQQYQQQYQHQPQPQPQLRHHPHPHPHHHGRSTVHRVLALAQPQPQLLRDGPSVLQHAAAAANPLPLHTAASLHLRTAAAAMGPASTAAAAPLQPPPPAPLLTQSQTVLRNPLQHHHHHQHHQHHQHYAPIVGAPGFQEYTLDAGMVRLLDDDPGFFDAAAAVAAAALGGWDGGGGAAAAADAPDTATISVSSSALASLLESFSGGGVARSSFVLSPPLPWDGQLGGGGGGISWIDLTGLSLSIHPSPGTSPANPLALRRELAAALAAAEMGDGAGGCGGGGGAVALLQSGDVCEGALHPGPHSGAGAFEWAAGAATGGDLAAFGHYLNSQELSRQQPQPQLQFDGLQFTPQQQQQQLLQVQRQRPSSGSPVHEPPALSNGAADPTSVATAAAAAVAAAGGPLLGRPSGPSAAPSLEPLLSPPGGWNHPPALHAALLRVLQTTPHLDD